MAENRRAKQPAGGDGRRPLLRRMDQAAVAALVTLALVGMGVYWVAQGGPRGELIQIDRAEPLEARYLVDINKADWPDASRLKVLANLVFAASDLPQIPFDSRTTPGVDAAERLLGKLLANGPRHRIELIGQAKAA